MPFMVAACPDGASCVVCGWWCNQSLSAQLPQGLPKPKNLRELVHRGKISVDELKKHRTPEDCWIQIKDKVYDVSGWNEHPGANVIFTMAGEDATDVFAAFHAGSSAQFLKEFEIGEMDYAGTSDRKLVPDEKQVAFEAAYRKLRAQLVLDGMFTASLAWYGYKMASQVALLSLAFVFAAYTAGSWGMVVLTSATVALFLQQSGWLCHDILHHQVFKSRATGHAWGLVWGNLAQGFSVSWWMNKHNSHHAVPNLVESEADAADGDPDIDTMPFLAWSTQMFTQREEMLKQSRVGRMMIRNQALVYFPLLGLARISWLFQGLQYAFPNMPTLGWSVKSDHLAGKKVISPMGEKAGLLAHYAWYLTMAYLVGHGAPSALSALTQALAFVFLSNVFTGLFLALVFGLGHNGMAVYHADERPDFWKLQVTTTRNIIGGKGIPQAFVDYFCGGLQYQVEHHLFPQIPRHNLRRVHERVVKFCKDEGVTFHEADMIVGTSEVLAHLRHVSREFIEHFPAL